MIADKRHEGSVGLAHDRNILVISACSGQQLLSVPVLDADVVINAASAVLKTEIGEGDLDEFSISNTHFCDTVLIVWVIVRIIRRGYEKATASIHFLEKNNKLREGFKKKVWKFP